MPTNSTYKGRTHITMNDNCRQREQGWLRKAFSFTTGKFRKLLCSIQIDYNFPKTFCNIVSIRLRLFCYLHSKAPISIRDVTRVVCEKNVNSDKVTCAVSDGATIFTMFQIVLPYF